MDLLLTPADPAFPTPKTRCVAIEDWDGGQFHEYPRRKARLRLVPWGLRRGSDVEASQEPYLELLHPTPQDELQPFLQTWLFFGLSAEFLGLNEVAPGVRLIDEATARTEIAQLHRHLAREEGGAKYLSGAAELDLLPLIRERTQLASDIDQRLASLNDCLHFALLFLHSVRDNLDEGFYYSIAALGDLLSTVLYTLASASVKPLSLNWQFRYISHGSSVESQMLNNGWCPSEIDKIRSQFTSLTTMHYASRLKNARPQLSHTHCSKACQAFQIDMATYRPLHAPQCEQGCPSINVDIAAVQSVLRSTDFYPVLRVQWPADEADGLRLLIKQYQPGESYVALSHVGCCASSRASTSHAWLFTVDETAVDASRYHSGRACLVSAAGPSHAYTSAEGALAGNLQIQFADRAFNIVDLLTQLSVAANQDVRYQRVWQDVTNQFYQLASLGFGALQDMSIPSTLMTLQRALHSRSVSVNSDESLCIATLMKLDAAYIASVSDAQQRMVRVWELLAQAGGGLPPNMILNVDEPLDVPGWRWAPRSLLGSATDESVLGISERIVRFNVETGEGHQGLGVPTPSGLQVRFPGYRLAPRARLPGLPLHPWRGLTGPAEDQVLVYDKSKSRWFRIVDWYYSRKVGTWTDEERQSYHKQQDGPLCRSIHTGNCCLIWAPPWIDDGPRMCCMVQLEPDQVNAISRPSDARQAEIALPARRERTVILSALNEIESRVMHYMQTLADSLAEDSATREYAEIGEQSGPKWQAAKIRVHGRIKDVVAAAWESEPWLQRAIADTFGNDLDEFVWVMVPKLFSHHVELEALPENQLWVVD
ncbi:hypothetical protein CDD83_3721 [Cordyceps sp. RAO-2017]|nr:hypothetical protein CDD83_3721 [Cordyceps sp. RAO-2017]